jgi:hypothetical protein
MLEFGLLLLVAGGLAMLGHYWMPRRSSTTTSSEQVLSTLAEGGLYRLSAPGAPAPVAAFHDLHLTTDGLALHDSRSGALLTFRFCDVQWVSSVEQQSAPISAIHLHFESERRWRILMLQLPHAELALLLRVLRRVIHPARSNLDRVAPQPLGPLHAYSISETLQGEISRDAVVGLYLLPHLLIVLHDDQVQLKIDLSSIRRVLAVERISGGLHRRGLDGILRLYSRHETACFALQPYRELAQEISFLARCPLEWITQLDKSEKV